MPASRPLALLAEVTHACPLRCAYCSNPLELVRARDELDAETWKRVLREAAELGVVQVHFSGGEPLARRDLEDLVAESARLGLYPFLVTGGAPCDEPRLARLRDAGLRALQISVQHPDPGTSDRLAGAVSFEAKRHAVHAAKRLGLHLTLNVVLHRENVDFVGESIDLAAEWGADRLELAHAQYVGWAYSNRAALLPSREQVERARERVEAARRVRSFEIVHVLPDWLQDRPKACLHGWGRRYLAVAPDGFVLPCQSAREIEGLEFWSVREHPLAEIWSRSPAFVRFRGFEWMPEPCRSCELRELDFGGCRCQSFRITGDASATDPVCSSSPHRELVDTELRRAPGNARPTPRAYGPRPDARRSTFK